MLSTNAIESTKSSISGLWVLLVANEGQIAITDIDGRIPMMARAGNDQTYLLGFKNMTKARDFMLKSSVADAEPRMVVKSNQSDYIRLANQAGVSGVLVDYDPNTQQYGSASEIY